MKSKMNIELMNILVADDNKSLRETIVQRLKEMDIGVEEAANEQDILETLRDKKGYFKFISLDTQIRSSGRANVPLIKKIKGIDPEINLISFSGRLLNMDFVFQSAKAGVSRFVYKEKGIEELQKVLMNLMAESPKHISNYLVDFLKDRKAKSEIRHFDCFVDDPFQLSFKEYLTFNKTERKLLQLRAREDNANWIKEELIKRKARWLLVIGNSYLKKNIVRYSPRLNELPKPDELRKLAKKYNHFPYSFLSPPMIEEDEMSPAIKWSETKYIDDYYPTLEICVGRYDWDDNKIQKDGLKLTADFDTGTAELYLDYEQLIKANIIREEDKKDLDMLNYGEAFHLNNKYSYVIFPIRFCFKGNEDLIISEEFQTFCVEKFRHKGSPFRIINSTRKALVGRSLLRNDKFSLLLQLNGKKRSTQIKLI